MWDDSNEREMRAQQAAEALPEITQIDILTFETCQFDTCRPCMPSERYDKCMRIAADKRAAEQMLKQLETTLDEIAREETDFRIYEQGERDLI
jgi:hypothetical protein